MLRYPKYEIILNSYFWIPLFIILCPTFPSIIGFGSQLVFVLNIILLLIMGILGSYKWKISWAVVLYGVYFISMASWDVLIELMNDTISPNDILEIVRPIGFLFFYLYYRNSVLPIEEVESQTLKMLFWTFTIICIYCILEFIFPDSVREISYFLWKRREVSILNNKAIGPFFQTYNSAYALLIPLFWSFINLIKLHKGKFIVFFILCLLTFILTQSRSMYICGVLGLFLCPIISTNFRSSKSIIKTILFFIIFTVSLIFLFFTFEDDLRANLTYAFQGFESMSQGTNNSLNTREAQIAWAVDNNTLMLIGGGTGKGEIRLESLYALYYYRYGVIGLIIFEFLTLYTGYVSWRISKRLVRERKYFYQALTIFFLLNPIALSSSCHHDMPKTSLLFYGMVGLIFYRYSTLKNEFIQS